MQKNNNRFYIELLLSNKSKFFEDVYVSANNDLIFIFIEDKFYKYKILYERCHNFKLDCNNCELPKKFCLECNYTGIYKHRGIIEQNTQPGVLIFDN